MKRSRSWHSPLVAYASAHWHGELPPGTSLWLNWALPAALAAVVLAALTAWMTVDGAQLRLAGLAFALGWPAALALDLWGAVGAWRSAARTKLRQAPRKRALASLAVRAAVLLGLAATATLAVLQHGRQWVQALQFVAGVDPAGHATLQPMAEGQRLRLQGHIGIGDAERLLQALASPPPLRVLELDSSGGRYAEAKRLAAGLRGQGWTTRVSGDCRNACVLVLLAGQRRQLMPGGRPGFNRAGTEHASPLVRWLARRRLALLLADAGLLPIFVLKAMSMPSTLVWQPGPDELLRGAFVSKPARPLDLELPPAAQALPADYADALRANPLWQTIDQRFAGTADDALRRLLAVRDAGGDDDALQAAAQAAVEPLLPQLLFNAGPDLREPYARLLADQIAALPDAEACRRLLAGDASVRRSLPLALAEREAAWLVDAMIEPPRETRPRRATSPEHEVIRRTLGGHAPAALGRLLQPAAGDARACARAATLLDEMLALPPAERKLALRLAFETP